MTSSDALVIHHHELGLKGRNRDFFEKILTRTLRDALKPFPTGRMRRGFGRIMIDLEPDGPNQEVAERAARLFGVAYVGLGRRVKPDLDDIAAAALDYMTAEPFDAFRVRARRTYSSFDMSSHQIQVELGRMIQEATDGGRVDLKHADATAWVELFGSTGIVYRERIEGTGGLPSGVSGKMLTLLSGGIDSPVAGWRMARRGATVEFLHFHGQPFTDPSSIRQAEELCRVFLRYHPRVILHLVPLGDIQREIVTHAPSELRVVLYRRAMLRIGEALAKQRGAKALVTGDALGQVASQTIENITTVDLATGMQVLRPLIGMTKQEIVDKAIEIGTYDISTRKYQDCCVLFEPRSPSIRTAPEQAEKAESDLDVEALTDKALGGLETQIFDLT